MSALFKKLNLKDQKEIVILNAPESFEAELAALKGISIVRDVKAVKELVFSMAFVTKQNEVDTLAKAVAKKAAADAVIWFVYPKGTSKKYKCEFNRDTGWAAMGDAGYEPVRIVAVDEDWSALRFRRVELIKNFTRNEKMVLSKEGKKRAAKK
jgi:hypothetical protein